jgi:hypothetical protein
MHCVGCPAVGVCLPLEESGEEDEDGLIVKAITARYI